MSLFLKALKGEEINRFPVWLMRQAGRYMPEYRKLRSKAGSFLNFCSNVDLATEVTLLPEKILNVDALILFSDILVPLLPMGVKVDFIPGEGPVLLSPPVDDLKEFEPSEVSYVFEIIVRVKEISEKPLIGFAGAPFTLGAYILEGRTSRDFKEIRKTYYGNIKTFNLLMEKLTGMLKTYLAEQIRAGTDAIQLFDSWAYIMSPEMFENYVPHLWELFSYLKKRYPEVPLIYFFRGSGQLYKKVQKLEGVVDALSLDWTLSMETALRELKAFSIQGNMDPTVLYTSDEVIEERVKQILETVLKYRRTRYVFNLGHGLAPDMEVEKVKKLVETVRNFHF